MAKAPELVDDGNGIIVNSSLYKGCPAAVKSQVKGKAFTKSERNEVEEVLDKYKPLMTCATIPLKKIGRTDKAISRNGSCVAETDTLGEWFEDQGGIVLTDAARTGSDFKDPRKQFRGTLAHEMSHALMNTFDPRDCKTHASYLKNPLMRAFMKDAGWNTTGTHLTQTADNKAPTTYAETNPQEDIAESAMFYLYEPETLKARSKKRFDFLDTLFKT